MAQLKWMNNQGMFQTTLAIALLAGLWPGSAALAKFSGPQPVQPAIARTVGGVQYKPRNPTQPKVPTSSGGSRGICQGRAPTGQSTQFSLTLLAPQKHIGVTAVTRPTFAWFVSEPKPHPIELTLFEYSQEKGRGNLIQTIKLQSSPGIMKLSLPEDQPGLVVGKTYVWQVALICNRNRPSLNPWAQAVIEVAKPEANLQQALSKTTDSLKRAELYIQARFWYDALAETLKSPAGQPLRRGLLTDLSESETPDQKARLETVITNDRN